MLRLNTVCSLVLASLLGVLIGASPTTAAVVGTNTVLNGNGGDLYIPLKPSTSGELGDGGTVGLVSDSVKFFFSSDSSSGFVTFVLAFDLSSEIGPGETLDQNTASIKLTFDDIDFAEDDYGDASLWEILELSFLPTPGSTPPVVADLTIDDTNYGDFGPGFVDTDNQELTYFVHLKDDLLVTPSEFLDIESSDQFALFVKFRSQLESNEFSFFGNTITNAPENIGNSFEFTKVPEPGTLTLIASGMALFIARRRRTV